MARKPIDLDGSTVEALVLLSEGNPGAVTVLGQIAQKYPKELLLLLFDLDDMNIRGSQIWVGYKDHCGENIDRFVQCIRDRDPDMIEKINEQCFHPDLENPAYHEKAIKKDGYKLNRGSC